MEQINYSQGSQAGIVSIMVTMIMMIVISLVVLGFAEIARSQQTNNLNNQLSVQAFYAAESGINDARVDINNQMPNPFPKTQCGKQDHYINLDGSSKADLNQSQDVSYTCVLIDPTPSTLIYTLSPTSTVIPIISTQGAFDSLVLSWTQPPRSTKTLSGCHSSTPSNIFSPDSGPGQWGCPYPVLRVDILNDNGQEALSRASWSSDTSTYFFIPENSNQYGEVSIGQHNGGSIAARCNTKNCTAVINGLGGSQYYMRVTSIYNAGSTLSITAHCQIPGNCHKTFSDAQATIDSTGKAQDILRRIEVAVDLTDANSYDIPSGSLITEDSICKKFGVYPGGTINGSGEQQTLLDGNTYLTC